MKLQDLQESLSLKRHYMNKNNYVNPVESREDITAATEMIEELQAFVNSKAMKSLIMDLDSKNDESFGQKNLKDMNTLLNKLEEIQKELVDYVSK